VIKSVKYAWLFELLLIDNFLMDFLTQPGHFQGNSYDIVSAFQVCLSPLVCSATLLL
jgi:hypothetical protein